MSVFAWRRLVRLVDGGKSQKAEGGWSARLTLGRCRFTFARARSSRLIRFANSRGQTVTEPATVRVYPGADDDDGQALGYRDGSDGKAVWIRLRWDDAPRRLTVEPEERMKRWPGAVRVFTVEAVGSREQPKQIEFRGQRVSVNL
jgi:hypothetical protein